MTKAVSIKYKRALADDTARRVLVDAAFDLANRLLECWNSQAAEQAPAITALKLPELAAATLRIVFIRCCEAKLLRDTPSELRNFFEQPRSIDQFDDILARWFKPSDATPLETISNYRGCRVLQALRKVSATQGPQALAAAIEGVATLDIEALNPAALGDFHEAFLAYQLVPCTYAGVSSGEVELREGEGRRSSGSHYTPEPLAASIVARALGPIVADVLATAPSTNDFRALLSSIRVCDPALGSGVFLRQAVDYLCNHPDLRHCQPSDVQERREFAVTTCLIGADTDPLAVELSRRILWLTYAPHLPGDSFLRAKLRHGDSLIAITQEQHEQRSWSPVKQTRKSEADASRGLQYLNDLSPTQQCDLLVSSFFTPDLHESSSFAQQLAADRQGRRVTRTQRKTGLQQVLRSLETANSSIERRRRADEVRTHLAPLHWHLEFPELCSRDDASNSTLRIAVVGNPPFVGGRHITRLYGASYLAWLANQFPNSRGSSDLAAYFFRIAARLVGTNGTIGFVATNTIAQGDTRITGLSFLVESGAVIYDAVRSMPWPGTAANVSVSTVHLAFGSTIDHVGTHSLDAQPATAIDTRLRESVELPEPKRLPANRGKSFQGSILRGTGFILDAEKRAELIAADPRNAERIFSYLGGEEVNRSPTQQPHRFAIDLANFTLDEARRWPGLLAHLEKHVLPSRQSLHRTRLDEQHRRRWWTFAMRRAALYETIGGLSRCLVTAIITKHLCFSFQPTDRIFSHKLCVFPFDDYGHFAMLQSRIHEIWARRLSSTFGDGLNYSPTDVFETFPFPQCLPSDNLAMVEAGRQLFVARANYLIAENIGLTECYNRLTGATDQREIRVLRELHAQVDRVVLESYDLQDTIELPPFGATNSQRHAEFAQAIMQALMIRNQLARNQQS